MTTSTEAVEVLLKRGNKGKTARDPHTCCLCQRKFSIRRHLKVHLQVIHCKSTKMFCDSCPKYYFSKDSLARHMKMHKKKRFSCKKCGHKTVYKPDMKKHKLTHKRKIECPICKKKVAVMKDHMITHRPKISCSICQMMISGKCMKKHMTRAHQVKCGT